MKRIICCQGERRRLPFMNRNLVIPLLIVLFGGLDGATTITCVLSGSGRELNPFMAGIVNSNLDIFLVIKLTATFSIALTYVFARQFLMKMPNKTGRTFNYSSKILTVAYIGLVCFLAVVVVNNLFIMLA
jgi:membrane protein DedA with SNARE-associated domain